MSAGDRVGLSIVLDGVGALRQRRLARHPDPLALALLAEQGGADGVTLRLRGDRSEIQERDVELVAAAMRTKLNLRVAASDELLAVVTRMQPARCCLVPEQRHDHAPGGGLDAARLHGRLVELRQRLHDAAIAVAARVDPTTEQVDACARAGLDAVELHCGPYALAARPDALAKRHSSLVAAARGAAAAGLTVYAGGGLDYGNVTSVVAIEEIAELRIGHAIIGNALIAGLGASIAQMRQLLVRQGARP